MMVDRRAEKDATIHDGDLNGVVEAESVAQLLPLDNSPIRFRPSLP